MQIERNITLPTAKLIAETEDSTIFDDGAINFFYWDRLKFNTNDEFIFYEALVHPAANTVKPKTALVIGGSDGMAARELLKYPSLEKITNVCDKEVYEKFKNVDELAKINLFSHSMEKVFMIESVKDLTDTYDLIIHDVPMEDAEGFSVETFKKLKDMLTPQGLISINAGSLSHNQKSFWCVIETLSEAGLYATPLHRCVPSLGGECGFVIGSKHPIKLNCDFKLLSYTMTPGSLEYMLFIPPEIQKMPVEASTEENGIISAYFSESTQPMEIHTYVESDDNSTDDGISKETV